MNLQVLSWEMSKKLLRKNANNTSLKEDTVVNIEDL